MKLLSIIGACAALATASVAYAFFPTNTLTTVTLGQGKSHQKITEEAITDLYQEFFEISDMSKPMKKAMEVITDANAEVDKDQFNSKKHFDAENFEGGKGFILANRKVVISAIKSGNVDAARFALGQSLHTLQDFYSHSNWIEMGNSGVNTALTRDSETINNVAGPANETCDDSLCEAKIAPVCNDCSNNITTTLLTSGYYSGEDRMKPTAVKKCSHGGPFDGSAVDPGPFSFTFGINKDYGDCLFSPHSHLHGAAASLGIEATKQYLRDIKDEITEAELKLLLGVGPTLAFVVDTTGSMGAIINNARAQIHSIINARLGTDEEPSQYVYTPFNDPSTGPVFKTNNIDTFKSKINSISVSGGGDCPEMSQGGIAQALTAVDNGGSVFMFTDATAKDASLAAFNASVASSKDIKIYPLLFGSCSPYDPSYFNIAEKTGGQVFIVSTSEAGAITKLADKVTKSNAAGVTYVSDAVSGSSKQFSIPVDLSIEELTFSLSGLVSYSLIRPDGTIVSSSDSDVELNSFARGAVISISDPTEGNWTIKIDGNDSFTLNVVADTPLDIDSFRFVESGGRPGHEGFYPVDGMPVTEGESTFILSMSGDYQNPELFLRDNQGNELLVLPMAKGSGQSEGEYLGTFDIEPNNYRVYVRGTDTAGNAFQRMLPKEIIMQPLEVRGPETAKDLIPGESTTFSFRVKNFGGMRNVNFSANDSGRFVKTVSPSSAVLSDGQEIEIIVELLIPEGAETNTLNLLTLLARDASIPEVNNFAVVNSLVVAEPIQNSSVSISTVELESALTWSNYAEQLAALGGSGPYEWSILEGELPSGIALDSLSGALSGIPTVAQSVSFSVVAVDSEGIESAPVTLSIEVSSGLTIEPFATFNLYSIKAVDFTDGDIDGRAGSGGDFKLTGFSLGDQAVTGNAIFSGGTVTLTNCSIGGNVEAFESVSISGVNVEGGIFSGGDLTGSGPGTIHGDALASGSVNLNQGITVTGQISPGGTFTPEVNHDVLGNYFSLVSESIFSLEVTGTAADNGWGEITLTVSEGVNVFTLDAENLSDSGVNNGSISKNIHTIRVSGEAESIVYINVIGAGNFELGGIQWSYQGGVNQGDILLNVGPQVETLTLRSGNNTNILAPNSSIHFADGANLEGSIVAKQFSGRVLLKNAGFSHDRN